MAEVHQDPLLPSNEIRDTGIDVIVVGAGFGGIACAVECKRKGHRVTVIEKVHEMKQLGQSLYIKHLLFSADGRIKAT
jgi:2-polyprenyl-6-methoxyphenol hydroxylase-like FAD-dependent oxidoreductase